MNIWSLFLQGIVLGIAAAATPGAFQVYLITQSIIHGFKQGKQIALAPLISDPPIVIIVLLFLNQLPRSFMKVVSIAGGIFVIYLAVSTYIKWRKSSTINIDQHQTFRGNIFRGAIINILSPGLYLYWTLVNGPLLLSALQQSYLSGVSFLIGFYGLFIGGMLAMAALFAQFRRLGDKFISGMQLISAIILASFGIFLLLRSTIY